MKKCTEKLMGLNQSRRHITTSHEPSSDSITAWRSHLRDSQYLADPKSGTELHTSMSGVELDSQLVNMSEIANKRRVFHMRQLFVSDYVMPSLHDIPQPLFVTAKEREEFCKISNKPNDTIRVLVLELIDQLDCSNLRAHYNEMWKRVKNKKKEDLVAFYEKVKEEVEDQMPLINLSEELRSTEADP